jgi:hypothetical protein
MVARLGRAIPTGASGKDATAALAAATVMDARLGDAEAGWGTLAGDEGVEPRGVVGVLMTVDVRGDLESRRALVGMGGRGAVGGGCGGRMEGGML